MPPIAGLTSDSREVLPGFAYFAIPGTRLDGHSFIPQAIEKGAATIVAEKVVVGLTVPLIRVPSSRRALAEAAAFWYGEPTKDLNVVGITGTNGKTTTSYLLRQVWEALGISSGLIGTIECWVGDTRESSTLTTPDPMTVQRLFSDMKAAQVSVAAMEVTSIALDQCRAHGTKFRVGVFTNLTHDHLDYHFDMASYYAAKLKLFTDFPLQAAVINIDDPYGQRLAKEEISGKVLTFALDRTADFSARSIRLEKSGIFAEIETPEGAMRLVSPLIGRHNLSNCFSALGALYALGVPLNRAIEALKFAPGAPGRLERVAIPKNQPHVFVDYAHTPDALENVLGALATFRRNQPGRLITVFGCGGDRDKAKRSRMAQIASRFSDVTIATSDNPRTENPDAILNDIEAGIDNEKTEYHREINRRAAIHLALELGKPEDIILVAGKGHETHQILGREEFPFDDRVVVRDYYEIASPKGVATPLK